MPKEAFTHTIPLVLQEEGMSKNQRRWAIITICASAVAAPGKLDVQTRVLKTASQANSVKPRTACPTTDKRCNNYFKDLRIWLKTVRIVRLLTCAAMAPASFARYRKIVPLPPTVTVGCHHDFSNDKTDCHYDVFMPIAIQPSGCWNVIAISLDIGLHAD